MDNRFGEHAYDLIYQVFFELQNEKKPVPVLRVPRRVQTQGWRFLDRDYDNVYCVRCGFLTTIEKVVAHDADGWIRTCPMCGSSMDNEYQEVSP